jgi:DNA-directed RNA polymerase specialized sigma24 family protein
MPAPVRLAYLSDLDIARSALSGDTRAAAIFVERFRPYLENYLVGRCRRGDSRSIEKSREIVADVISDCFGAKNRARGEPVLLKLYHAQGFLHVWLRGVAYARLKSWWVSRDFRGVISLADTNETRTDNSTNAYADPEVVKILRIALENAFREIEPSQLLFLRLVYLEGVKRDHLAKACGCHPAKITRDLSAALAKIRKLTLRYVRVLDPAIELRWEDCQAICDYHAGMLRGTAADSNSIAARELHSRERSRRHHDSVGLFDFTKDSSAKSR